MKKPIISAYILCIFIPVLFIKPDIAYGWIEMRWEPCSWSPPEAPHCCIYSRMLSFNPDTCELVSSGEHSVRSWTGACLPEYPDEWNTAENRNNYPTDSNGNILASIGGCNDSTAYYNCSPIYQDAIDFSSNHLGMSRWWYFTSTDNDGNSYKCIASYINNAGTKINHRLSDYHSLNPATSSDCVSEEALDALNNTICSQEPNAFNTGIYTTYGNPDSTYACIDQNGNGTDDSTGTVCDITAQQRPEGKIGNPAENAGPGINSNCSNRGAPSWKVDMVNMNIYIADIPLWYSTTIGPSVNIQISYNSLSSRTQNTAFGNKWILNYESSLYEDVSGNITILMPDGREDIFRPDTQGGYIRPYSVFNSLRKIAINNFELELLDGTVYAYSTSSSINPGHFLLTEILDSYNQKITFEYNNDKLITITDAINRVTHLRDIDGDEFIDQIDDPFGRSAYFQYDASHNLTTITDMGGYSTSLSYDTNGYIKTISNSTGTWGFDIEPSDDVMNISDTYPAPGHPMGENYRITVTSPLGNKEEYYYFGPYSWYVSPRDYVPYSSAEDNNFRSAPKTYYFLTESHKTGKIDKVRMPEGGYLQYGHDPSTGNLSSVMDSHGNGEMHSQNFRYNINGLVKSFTDAKGNITTFEYHPNNIDVWQIKFNPVSTPEDDNILLKTFTYDGNSHNLSSITDRFGSITDFTYNALGQLSRITRAVGSSVEMRSDFIYNPLTHELTETMRNSNTTDSFTHDAVGRIMSYTDDRNITLRYEYNNLDCITKIIYPDDKFESITYSDCCPGLIDSKTDRAGFTNKFTYDALKRLTSIQTPAGFIRYKYDLNSNLIKVSDFDGKETTFNFNLDNRQVKKTYADGRYVQYTYDLAGLLTRFINSRNVDKIYSYDNSHNSIAIVYSDSTPDVTYSYDIFDRLETMADVTGLYRYSYDDADRLTGINGPWLNDTISMEFDELGRLKQIIPQGGETLTYMYDSLGRITHINYGSEIFTYNYTGVNPLLQSLTRPNSVITEYHYDDPLSRLTEITNKTSEQLIINRYLFTYNNFDLIDTETSLTDSPITSFQEGLKTYNYNNLNQLSFSTNADLSFNYDEDGNMTQGYTPQGYVMNMTYDAENRLTSTEYTDSEGVLHRTEYIFNGNNLLTKVKKYDNSSLINDIRLLRAGFLTIQERDSNNNITREYNWGSNMAGGIGGLLSLKQNGSYYSYLYDGKGNVTAILDDSQNVVSSYRYDVFGNIIEKLRLDQPFKFSTKRHDESTGLSYYGYRFYNPAIGRWITRDPLGEAGGINLYGFVGNNPINRVDLLGLWGEDVHSGIGNTNYGTYKWAIDAGFSPSESKVIATANNAVDKLGNWAPIIGVPGRHFNTAVGLGDSRNIFSRFDMQQAIKHYKQGNKCKALRSLGQGLHSVQDIIAHGSWIPLWPHPLSYDNPKIRPLALQKTELLTKGYFSNFMQGVAQ
jgi:RHS repeat-associated protein